MRVCGCDSFGSFVDIDLRLGLMVWGLVAPVVTIRWRGGGNGHHRKGQFKTLDAGSSGVLFFSCLQRLSLPLSSSSTPAMSPFICACGAMNRRGFPGVTATPP